MRMRNIVEKTVEKRLSHKRGSDQRLVFPLAKRRDHSLFNSTRPETALGLVEAFRPVEPHAPKFVRDFLYSLAPGPRNGTQRHAGQCLEQIAQRMIRGDRVRAVCEYTVQRHDCIPTFVESQIP